MPRDVVSYLELSLIHNIPKANFRKLTSFLFSSVFYFPSTKQKLFPFLQAFLIFFPSFPFSFFLSFFLSFIYCQFLSYFFLSLLSIFYLSSFFLIFFLSYFYFPMRKILFHVFYYLNWRSKKCVFQIYFCLDKFGIENSSCADNP